MGRRNAGGGKALMIMIVAIGTLTVWMLWKTVSGSWGHSDSKQALAAVEQFYRYEQGGDFGSSWELFHPLMQQRFEKAEYIQKRAHIMMQDFGVKTFQVSVGAPKRLNAWRMSPESEPLDHVYEMTVTESFESPYGDFSIHQPSFAAYADGKWKVLWSYQANVH